LAGWSGVVGWYSADVVLECTSRHALGFMLEHNSIQTTLGSVVYPIFPSSIVSYDVSLLLTLSSVLVCS